VTVIPSWNATTPAGTWIEVELQGRLPGGRVTRWYSFGRWAYTDADIERASVPAQADGDGDVAVDTFVAEAPLTAYRLRLTPTGAAALTRLAAVASGPPDDSFVPSATRLTQSVDLAVPAFSQEIHAGEYPQFDGGGEAWCSPTATSMVVAYWATGPGPEDYAYVYGDYPDVCDPCVDYAARHTYDYAYRGTGNWCFNVAYAAHWGLVASVTRLRSLVEAERLVAAGIPLVASIALEPGELDGFLLPRTSGHLVVVGGFTASGDVVAYDPAAQSDAEVRRVYDRAQLERAWLCGSGGIVYLIHPPEVTPPV
jgi:peptidase C39-like protein